MILQLVSDGRRLAPGHDVAGVIGALAAQSVAAVAAGVDMIQIRESWLEARELHRLAATIVAVASGTKTRVLVNDRLDVALAAGASGVHLTGRSFAVGDARRMAPAGFIVGRSVHSLDEARSASDADYLSAGTIWPTPSKPDDHPTLGPDGLRQIVAATRVPVLAIGGITPERLGEVAAAGAAGAAAIGLFLSDDLAARVTEARRRFDTPTSRS